MEGESTGAFDGAFDDSLLSEGAMEGGSVSSVFCGFGHVIIHHHHHSPLNPVAVLGINEILLWV